MRHIIIDQLEKKINNRKISNDIQAIPKKYFLELTLIPFENLLISAPNNYIDYLEMVYGKDWSVSNPNWERSQNKINAKY